MQKQTLEHTQFFIEKLKFIIIFRACKEKKLYFECISVLRSYFNIDESIDELYCTMHCLDHSILLQFLKIFLKLSDIH